MADQAKENRLLKYLDALVEKLRGLAARAVVDGDIETIHDARVATRRLKAAAELLEPLASKRHRAPLLKISRKLRKRLGRLRDLDVIIEHLQEMINPRLAPAAQWAIGQFTDEREKAFKKAVEDLPTPRVLSKLASWYALRQELADGGDAMNCLLAESVHLQLDEFTEAAAQMIDPQAGHDPHALRIAGKSLRYTLEMAKAHGLPLPRTVLLAFRRMQTALGLWHDYVVLSDAVLCQASERELALHSPELQKSALAAAAAGLRRSQRYLERAVGFWKLEGGPLVEQIRGSFPLTHPAEPPAPPDESAVASQA